MNIFRTERFKKSWHKLSIDEKALARKAIEKLVMDMRYPSLRINKMQGTDSIWEARASRSLRITFQLNEGDLILRNIGKHDKTLDNP